MKSKAAVHLPYRSVCLALASAVAGCAIPVDGADPALGAAPAVTAEKRSAIVAGCIPSKSNYFFTGSSYDALTGSKGGFAFDQATYGGCDEPATNNSTVYANTVNNHYELHQVLDKSITVEGSGSYGPYSATADVSYEVQQKTNFSDDRIVQVFDMYVQQGEVTLKAETQFSPAFVAALRGPDGQRQIHNQFGDVYVKTATLGHRLIIVFTAQFSRGEKWKKEDFADALNAKVKLSSGLSASLDTKMHSSKETQEIYSKMAISSIVKQVTNGVDVPLPVTTVEAIPQVMNAFKTGVATRQAVVVGMELERFGHRLGFSDADFFDWQGRANTIAGLTAFRANARAVAGTNTDYQNLTSRAQAADANLASVIAEFQGFDVPSSANLDAYMASSTNASLMYDFGNYRQFVDASYKLRATRDTTTCLGMPGSTAGYSGATLAGQACSGADNQLFRYDSSTKSIMTLAGHCLDTQGAQKFGNLVTAPCTGASSQRWTFSVADRKIDTWNLRTIHFVSSDLGGQVRGWRGSQATATDYGRSYWKEMDWQMTQL